MKIYISNTTNFNNNGLGFLKDCLSADVVESLNGDMYLNLTYPLYSPMSEYLKEENIIKCNTGNDNYQLFRISKITKNYDEINVYAPHIFYDLNTNFLLDVAPTNLDTQSFGNWILSRTNYENTFRFQSDISEIKSARYVRRNPVEAIIGDIDNSMINLFGGDLERDNFTIKLLTHRGDTNPKKLIFGKNIEDIKVTIDNSGLFTRVLPLGFDGLMLPETFVDSPLINEYLTPKIGKVEFSNIKYDPESEEEDVFTNVEDAYSALRDAVTNMYTLGLDKPKINIKVNWIELSKTKEYYDKYSTLETMNIGDEVIAEIFGLNYSTRIIRTTYNVLTNTIDKFEVGTMTNSISNTINAMSEKPVQSIEIKSLLESAKNNATELITTALGGYIYKTQNELYIMDTDNPNTARKVWRWNINGLGYSSTGINGQYQTAMTQDGQIVADMITTGTMSVDRISGLENLMFTVGQIGTYLQLKEDGRLVLGNSNGGYTLVMEGNRIAIYYGDIDKIENRQSYWENKEFTIEQLNLGNFAFIPRENGSLGFRKVR